MHMVKGLPVLRTSRPLAPVRALSSPILRSSGHGPHPGDSVAHRNFCVGTYDSGGHFRGELRLAAAMCRRVRVESEDTPWPDYSGRRPVARARLRRLWLVRVS